MLDIICGLIAVAIGLFLSTFDWIGDREIKILTILGWVIAVLAAKGGYHD